MEYKDKNFVSFLIYLDNNFELFYSFYKKVLKELNDNFENFEIILLIDSKELLLNNEIKNRIKNQSLQIINISKSESKDSSINLALNKCIGDYIFIVDSYIDNQDYVDLLFTNYEVMIYTYDITVFQAKISNKFINIFCRIINFRNLNKINIKPMAMSIISRKALNRVRSEFNITTFRSVEYALTGLNINYVNLDSKFKFQNNLNFENIVDIAILHSNIVFKYISYTIVLFFLISVFSLFYTFYFFLTRNVIEGWSTIMSFLSISFFGIFLILYFFLRYLNLMLRNLFFKKNAFVGKIDRLQ
jgi:dolichol-phosphate mannosyltransferase